MKNYSKNQWFLSILECQNPRISVKPPIEEFLVTVLLST